MEVREKKLVIRVDENGSGYATIYYQGLEVATAYALEIQENAVAWAKIVLALNDWPEEMFVEVVQWLRIKATYINVKFKLERLKDPFTDSDEDIKAYEEAKAAHESEQVEAL